MFSKLQETGLPVQPSNPCTLNGKTVVLLDRFNTGVTVGIVDRKPDAGPAFPLTVEQRDAGVDESNLKGQSALLRDSMSRGTVLLMKEEAGFYNMNNKPPKIEESEVPSFYTKAGPQADQALLNPAQRRAIMKFDSERVEATHYVKKAVEYRAKTRKIVCGPQYKRGILGIDSNENLNSDIYGEQAQRIYEGQQRSEQHHQARMHELARRTGSMHVQGNILIPESLSDDVKCRALFQTKGGPGGKSIEAIKEDLFPSFEPPKFNNRRAQNLRDRDLAGKNQDFIFHREVTLWPSLAPNKQHDRMLHPSQTSLESVRNLQGAGKNAW